MRHVRGTCMDVLCVGPIRLRRADPLSFRRPFVLPRHDFCFVFRELPCSCSCCCLCTCTRGFLLPMDECQLCRIVLQLLPSCLLRARALSPLPFSQLLGLLQGLLVLFELFVIAFHAIEQPLRPRRRLRCLLQLFLVCRAQWLCIDVHTLFSLPPGLRGSSSHRTVCPAFPDRLNLRRGVLSAARSGCLMYRKPNSIMVR